MHISRFGKLGVWGAILLNLGFASIVMAAKPQLDSGFQLDVSKPYDNAQVITDIPSDKSVYGKLEGATPVDIYKFVPTSNVNEFISLFVDPSQYKSGQSGVTLVFVDSTSASKSESLGLPLPTTSYHTTLVKTAPASDTYYEPALMRQFDIVNMDSYNLKKGVAYYLIVIDPSRVVDNYVIHFGPIKSKSWTVKDFFVSFGTWWRLETNSYAGSSPFHFNVDVFGLFLFFLGFTLLFGVTAIQETYSFMANAYKSAGYILVKMQPVTKIVIWGSLWLAAIGGLIYFDHVSWVGTPFVLILIFVIITLNSIYITFGLSPMVGKIEVSKREAVIPFSLRKRWFFSSIITILTFISFLVFLAVYFAQ
jgi:hypothetical protein